MFCGSSLQLKFAIWQLKQTGARCRIYCGVYRTVASSDLWFPAFPKVCIFKGA